MTTMNPTKARSTMSNGAQGTPGSRPTRETRPRVRGSARGGTGTSEPREAQYDLLTAALVGLAIGAGATLLLRRGPGGQRPISPAWRAAQTGARASARLAGRGARYAWDRGVDAWDHVPREEIAEKVHDYVESARDTIEELVQSELEDLRRAIRRQRKKLGI